MGSISSRTKVVSGLALAASGIASLTGAVPAQAVENSPVGWEPCLDITDQTDGSMPIWLGMCTPQYGLGKAEFTISSDVDFPVNFDLANATLTYDSRLNQAAAEQYLGLEPGESPPIGYRGQAIATSPSLIVDSTSAREQQYLASYPVPVESVTALAPENYVAPAHTGFAAACWGDSPPSDILQVSYTAFSMTYSQVIDGVRWDVPVTVAPTPLNVSFYDNQGSHFCVWNGSLWQDEVGSSGPLASGLSGLLMGMNVADLNPHPLNFFVESTESLQNPDGFLGFANLGMFRVSHEVLVVTADEASAAASPELAATGAAPQSLLLSTLGGFLALVAGFVLLRRRRLSGE